MTRKLAVMTGETSGIGQHAAQYIGPRFDTLLMGKRSPGAMEFGRAIPLDLAKLESAERFCVEVLAACGDQKIDLLVLNAGGNFPHDKTKDGFEKNFAINHLAHYLLLRRLLPALSQGARIVITTSGTHDPAENAAIPAPKHADARRLAFPETDPEFDGKLATATSRAYSAAKLCNLLTAQALARLPDIQDRQIDVIAFSPGPTPGTGLVGSRGLVMGTVFRYILPVMAGLSSKMHRPETADRALADVALGEIRVPTGQVYALLRSGKVVFPDPSALARDETVIAGMWRDSAELLSIPADTDQELSGP